MILENLKSDLQTYLATAVDAKMKIDAEYRAARLHHYADIPADRDDLLPSLSEIREQYTAHLTDYWQFENRRGRYAAWSEEEWVAEMKKRDSAVGAAWKADKPSFMPVVVLPSADAPDSSDPAKPRLKPTYERIASYYGI